MVTGEYFPSVFADPAVAASALRAGRRRRAAWSVPPSRSRRRRRRQRGPRSCSLLRRRPRRGRRARGLRFDVVVVSQGVRRGDVDAVGRRRDLLAALEGSTVFRRTAAVDRPRGGGAGAVAGWRALNAAAAAGRVEELSLLNKDTDGGQPAYRRQCLCRDRRPACRTVHGVSGTQRRAATGGDILMMPPL